MAYKSFYIITAGTNPGMAKEFCRAVRSCNGIWTEGQVAIDGQTVAYGLRATTPEDAIRQFNYLKQDQHLTHPATVGFCTLDYKRTIEARKEDLKQVQDKAKSLKKMIAQLEKEEAAKTHAVPVV